MRYCLGRHGILPIIALGVMHEHGRRLEVHAPLSPWIC